MKVETVLGRACSRSFDRHKMSLPNNVAAYVVNNDVAKNYIKAFGLTSFGLIRAVVATIAGGNITAIKQRSR